MTYVNNSKTKMPTYFKFKTNSCYFYKKTNRTRKKILPLPLYSNLSSSF
jgi:hypothetical protein